MKTTEQYMVMAAQYRFGVNNIFEDIINGQKSLHLDNVTLARGFDFFPLPFECKVILDNEKELVQKLLKEHTEGYCETLNELDEDIQYKQVHLDCLTRIHSAVIRYQRIGNEYKAQSMILWYVTETIELDGFLESEVEKCFSYEQ